MKRFVLLALIFVIVAIFCGCSKGKVSEQDIKKSQIDNCMFMRISDEFCGYVIVDKQTKVMYWESDGSYGEGVLTLLVNPDGTPRIWEG